MGSHTEACGELLTPLRNLLGLRQFALRRAHHADALPRSATGLLAELVRNGQCRAADLAAHRALDASVVSRQLAHLENEGLIERSPDPEDRRVALLRATEDGVRELAERDREKARWLSHVLRNWDEEQLSTLSELLRAFSDDLLEASRELLAKSDDATEEGCR